MFDGPSVVAALKECGVSHVVWVPDSEIGRWESALASDRDLKLVRVCREGEAMAIAAGLLIAGKQPVVMIQCTGLFEAGDALRNVVHDLHLPLFLVVGVRSWNAYKRGQSGDSCPRFTEPILQAWQIPHTWLDEQSTPANLAAAYREAHKQGKAAAVLIPE